jgi:hypothetical protein
MTHKVFIVFLVFITAAAAIAIGIRGAAYYATPVHLRPFRSDYEAMKGSGNYSHGLGIIGASMITVGVAMYSTRKRLRALWSLGRLSAWLEIHIFLCLMGPILVIYHTTFKAGGVAAISLWAMVSVAGSGVVGRFLYAQIPRNVQGTELTGGQIKGELDRLAVALSSSPLGLQLMKRVDDGFSTMQRPENLSQAVVGFIRLQSMRRHMKHTVGAMLKLSALSTQQAHQLHRTATARASLMQKSLVLNQAGKLFYFWHAVHLPFTIIMFITLAAHVVVAILMGYTWIF